MEKTVFFQQHPANKHGFTLIEVLISLLVFMIGVVSVANAISSLHKYQTASKIKMITAICAQAKLENIHTRNFSEFQEGTILNDSNDTKIIDLLKNSNDSASYANNFKFSITTENIETSDNLKRISLNIYTTTGFPLINDTVITYISDKDNLE